MGSWKFFLAAILLSCIVMQASSITIGNLFGTTRTELSPPESEEEPIEEAKKKGDHKPSKIPVPAIPKPELPHKHKKPVKHEEAIIATKTVFVEVTSRVTTHPVCVAVHGIKPPCLPYISNHHPPHYHGKDNHEQRESEYDAASFIEPSAAYHNLEPTRILDSVSLSENEEVEAAEIPYEEEGRSGRYLEVGMPTPVASLKSSGEINEEPELNQNARLVDGLFYKAPAKHYTTKTLWVTKVEKLIDYRVTATLEAKNCVPVDLQILLCSSPHEVYAPGYSPNHGVYVEGETGSNHVYTSGQHNQHVVNGLPSLFGSHRPSKPSRPNIQHKPSHNTPEIHKPIPTAHKPKPVVHHKPQVKPQVVHKPGYIPRDEIKESEAESIDLPADATVEKEVEVQDE